MISAIWRDITGKQRNQIGMKLAEKRENDKLRKIPGKTEKEDTGISWARSSDRIF